MELTRRTFLRQGMATAAFGGLAAFVARAAAAEPAPAAARDAGPLIPDPKGLLDLPAGWSYRVLANKGDAQEGGWRMPGALDGMCAFAVAGRTVLVVNHELSPDMADHHPGPPVNGPYYDTGCIGGTSTLVLSADGTRVERSIRSLLGTNRNCAGGPTPWNSWITCEESTDRAGKGPFTRDHGFAFDVPAAAMAPVDPKPLTAMGRFRREAIAIDPATGIVYQTEDDRQGCFYRFIPRRPGDLTEGRLQALRCTEPGAATLNWKQVDWPVGVERGVEWLDVVDTTGDTPGAARKAGATVFTRGEGMWFHDGSVWFVCTDGGPKRRGQVWRLTPGKAGDRLRLFLQPDDAALLENGDNLTVAPWGDLILCEDNAVKDATPENRLIAVTPEGRCRPIASHRAGSELAGACFAPDGRTLFVNIMFPGTTLAVTGPW